MTSIARAIHGVLSTPEPRGKVMIARAAARDWQLGLLDHSFDLAMPDAPARPARPLLLPPNKMPSRRKGQSEANRIALLHALAHIEFSAIDLAFDMAGRFGGEFGREFIDDWIKVGAEEAMHFALLDRRLRQMGSRYGDLPAHDGLWEAAAATSHDVTARLAIVPMVLEARGLDVSPATIDRLKLAQDETSAAILARIYRDEIRHVGVGVKWFTKCCESWGFSPEAQWQSLVQTYFRGALKPPFNDSARAQAGLTREYYSAVAR
jgi:uncharacterized ferritin-like protein (DUF455 family)